MIRLDDTVVVRTLTDTNSQLQVLKAASDQKMGKSRVSLKDTVGQRLGSLFELNNRKYKNILEKEKLVLIDEKAASYVDTATIDPALGSTVLGKRSQDSTLVRGDNSFYVDTNTAQKLTEPDICRLKESGLNGEEIIRTLIENSETFASKTDFAQEKWIKRKEMKYRKKLRIVKATPQSICEASFLKNKEKICNMRYDSLAQILSQSGISAGSRVMVVESTVGMVTGSVAYRMRGQGRIVSIYGGQQPHLDMVKMFNLTATDINIIQAIPSVELGPAAKDVCRLGFEAEEVEGDDKEGGVGDGVVRAPEIITATNLNATGRTKEEQNKVRSYLRRGVDSLIIACRYRPLPLLKLSLCLLHASSAFVVYHEFMEPLVECYLYLQQTAVALRIVLADTWLREFQTLPGRVRPDMFMSTSGGYLLSGIYVGTVPCPFPLPHVNNYGSNSSSSHPNGNIDSQVVEVVDDNEES